MTGAFERQWLEVVRARQAGTRPEPGDLRELDQSERALLRLYADFLAPPSHGIRVLAHLGVSLCGRIATATGHSTYINGEANLVHLHRLRALSDAVLVGAGTVAQDDPQLTVRHVEGPCPLRIVLDPERRLLPDRRVFTEVPPATLLLCRAERARRGRVGEAELVPVEVPPSGLTPEVVLDVLARRGVRRLFVEGGGVTVSRFLEAGCLDHLHLCLAPVIIGSGREGLRLPPIASMEEALRVEPVVVPMGRDWLFACDLERRPLSSGSTGQIEDVLMPDAKRASTRLDR